jgi:hypothetical protein
MVDSLFPGEQLRKCFLRWSVLFLYFQLNFWIDLMHRVNWIIKSSNLPITYVGFHSTTSMPRAVCKRSSWQWVEIPSHLPRWVVLSCSPCFDHNLLVPQSHFFIALGTMSSMIPYVNSFFGRKFIIHAEIRKKLAHKHKFCRSAKAASSHYRLECLCKCKETCRWGLCPIYLVCPHNTQDDHWALLYIISPFQHVDGWTCVSPFLRRNDNNQLLLGIRRATRPQTVMPSSVLSSDSMHIGLLAAAAHAASTNSRFTIFYNPR